MAKKYIVAAMLAAAFGVAWLAIRTFHKPNEPMQYDVSYTWHAEYDEAAGAMSWSVAGTSAGSG
jgi:hypothetical protein